MRHALRAAAAAAVLTMPAILGAACDGGDPLEPDPSGSRLLDGQVLVALEVTPDTLPSPGTILATLVYDNLGDDTVVLTSASSCLSLASVYLGEDRIPFPATNYGCYAVITHHDLVPGDPIVVRWTLEVGEEDGYPAGPGTYRFVADLETHREVLEQTFVIE